MRAVRTPPRLLAVFLACISALARADVTHLPLDEARPFRAVEVKARVVGERHVKFWLLFRGPDDEFTEVRMERLSDGQVRGLIPTSYAKPPWVEYYLEGERPNGDREDVAGSAQRPVRVLLKEGSSAGTAASAPGTPRRFTEPEKPKPEPATAPAPASAASTPAPTPRTAAERRLADELGVWGAEDPWGRTEALARADRRAGWTTTRLTRPQLVALGVRSVAEALDVLEGVTTSRDVQGFSRIALRSRRSANELPVYLDGVLLSDPWDGEALWNLPIHNIERIELRYGPGSARPGASGLAGAVSIFTRRARGLSAAFQAGLFESFDGAAAGTQVIGGFTFGGDVAVRGQRGQRLSIAHDSLDKPLVEQGFRSALDPAGVTDQSGLLATGGVHLNYESEGGTRAGLQARLVSEHRGALVGLLDTVGPGSQLQMLSVAVAAELSQPLASSVALKARFEFGQHTADRRFVIAPPGYRSTAVTNNLFTNGVIEDQSHVSRHIDARVGLEAQLGDNNVLEGGLRASFDTTPSVTYGINATNDNQAVTTVDVPGDPTFVLPTARASGAYIRRVGFGAWLSDRWTFFDALTIDASVAGGLIQLPSRDSAGVAAGTAFVPTLEPRLALAVSPIDSLVFRGGWSHALWAPSFAQLSLSLPNNSFFAGRPVGNPLLVAPIVDAFSVGGTWALAVGDATLRIHGELFLNLLSNPIEAIDTTGALVTLQNRPAGVRVMGAEGEAALEFMPRGRAVVNASWFRAEDLGTAAGSSLLTDTPQSRMNAMVTFPVGPYLNLDVSARVGAERRNNSRSVLEVIRQYRLPMYALLGAQLRSEKLVDHLEVILAAQNLFDLHDADDAPRPDADRLSGGVPRDGFNAFLTLKGEL